MTVPRVVPHPPPIVRFSESVSTTEGSDVLVGEEGSCLLFHTRGKVCEGCRVVLPGRRLWGGDAGVGVPGVPNPTLPGSEGSRAGPRDGDRKASATEVCPKWPSPRAGSFTKAPHFPGRAFSTEATEPSPCWAAGRASGPRAHASSLPPPRRRTRLLLRERPGSSVSGAATPEF